MSRTIMHGDMGMLQLKIFIVLRQSDESLKLAWGNHFVIFENRVFFVFFWLFCLLLILNVQLWSDVTPVRECHVMSNFLNKDLH